MERKSWFTMVLPGRELIMDFEPTDNLLKSLGTSVKEVIEMFINTWAEYKSVESHGWSRYTPIRNIHEHDRDHPAVVELRLQARWLVTDIILENAYKRIEKGEIIKSREVDLRDAEKVMMSLWAALSEYIFSLIDEMGVTDEQIGHLRFDRWIGDDFIITLPRQHGMHELRRQEELKSVENLRASSPLCNHYGRGWSGTAA